MAQPIATIELEFMDDGSIMVNKESAVQEVGEAEATPDTNSIKAKNLDDALNIARSMAESISAPASQTNQPVVPKSAIGLGINRSKPGALSMR